MIRLSLIARLVGIFLIITVLCFSATGWVLSSALSSRIYAQDDNSLLLSSQRLRRTATELDSPASIGVHRDRLVNLMLGDDAVALRVLDAGNRVLVDYDPSGIPIERPFVVSADHPILPKDIQDWTTSTGAPIRGVATHATLQDGSSVVIIVARVMSDRRALIRHYNRIVMLTMLLGVALATGLSLVLVRRSLLPLRLMASSASAITIQQLHTRLDGQAAPKELRALIQSLNQMLGRLEQGFAHIGQFTTDLAHDLRTPIGNLRGTTEVALTRPRSSLEYQALLASNLEEYERVTAMIERVLFLARAEHPSFALYRTNFPAGDELARVAEYFEGLAADAEVTLKVDGQCDIFADRELFRRAVSNLVANALRYTPRGGEIVLRVGRQHGVVSVCVENPGEHIPEEHLDKLFDRFYRVDKARSDSAASTGLGLAIVKSIMDLHAGSAAVSSRPGQCTRFALDFPDSQEESC